MCEKDEGRAPRSFLYSKSVAGKITDAKSRVHIIHYHVSISIARKSMKIKYGIVI